MNLRILAQSLDMREVNELSNILHNMKREWAKNCASPLSNTERCFVDSGRWIMAVKEYRIRRQLEGHDCSLLEAKIAVEAYKDRKY